MAAVLPRKPVRARKKAAGAPRTMASAAVEMPTTSERVMAVIQVGCSRMAEYHLSEPHLGGHSMKASVVKETGTMKKLGAARKINSTATATRSATRPDARGRPTASAARQLFPEDGNPIGSATENGGQDPANGAEGAGHRALLAGAALALGSAACKRRHAQRTVVEIEDEEGRGQEQHGDGTRERVVQHLLDLLDDHLGDHGLPGTAEQRRRNEKPERGDEDEKTRRGHARQRQGKVDAPEGLSAASAERRGGRHQVAVDGLHHRQHGEDREGHQGMHHADHDAGLLKSRSSGASVNPADCRKLLMAPRRPSRTIQAKVRTRKQLVQNGRSTLGSAAARSLRCRRKQDRRWDSHQRYTGAWSSRRSRCVAQDGQ